jgi:hypothetical protein
VLGADGAGTEAAAGVDDSARTAWPSCQTACLVLLMAPKCRDQVPATHPHIVGLKELREICCQEEMQRLKEVSPSRPCIPPPALTRIIRGRELGTIARDLSHSFTHHHTTTICYAKHKYESEEREQGLHGVFCVIA